ncbi:hypothetical protein TRVL_07777 [Trypanosoma vivax]|nr:hypothetical protein TRVL_07777 [Trypanosoma vivax]
MKHLGVSMLEWVCKLISRSRGVEAPCQIALYFVLSLLTPSPIGHLFSQLQQHGVGHGLNKRLEDHSTPKHKNIVSFQDNNLHTEQAFRPQQFLDEPNLQS